MRTGARSRWRRSTALAGTAAVVAALLGVAPLLPAAAAPDAPADGSCRLGSDGAVQHVVYVQFDNTHFLRDKPNVPSDLEQMPHLLSFLRDNGTLLTDDHTILISHTAGGLPSSLTGVYPDRHRQVAPN